MTPPKRDLDLVAVGSTAIDHIHRVTVLPKRDAGVAILDRQSGPGGVEGNIAAAASRLGLRVGIISHVGNDEAGTMLLADFQERGIDTTRMQVGGDGETAYTLAFVDGQGDRIMMTGGLGVRGLRLDDADEAYIRQARVCATSAYLPWPGLEVVAAICAEPDGPLLTFDFPGEFDDLEGRGFRREHLEALLPNIDLLVTSWGHLRSYTQAETVAQGLAYLYDRGTRRAAISDGTRGVSLFEAHGDDRRIVHVPAFPVPVVDTTGAGDVLHAALAAEWLLAGRPASVAGRFTAAAAALSCQGWGTRAALPTRDEVEALADGR
jgi:sulfofructose kinase